MKSLFVPMSETQCVTHYVLNDRKWLETAKNEHVCFDTITLHSVCPLLYIVMFICAPVGVPNGNLFSFSLKSLPGKLSIGRDVDASPTVTARPVDNFGRRVLQVVKNLLPARFSCQAMGNEVPKQAHTALIMENMIYPTGNGVSVAENGFISGSQLFGVFEINIMNICHNEIKWRISLWIFHVKEALARLMSYSLLGLWA